MAPIYYKRHDDTKFIQLVAEKAILMTNCRLSVSEKSGHIVQRLKEQYPDHYVLCVGYGVGDKDIQVGITETLKVGEGYMEAAIRGLREEAHLCSPLIQMEEDYFECGIGEHVLVLPKDGKDTEGKVSVYVHGTCEDFMRTYCNCIPEEYRTDNISWFVIIPLSRFMKNTVHVTGISKNPLQSTTRKWHYTGICKQREYDPLYLM